MHLDTLCLYVCVCVRAGVGALVFGGRKKSFTAAALQFKVAGCDVPPDASK